MLGRRAQVVRGCRSCARLRCPTIGRCCLTAGQSPVLTSAEYGVLQGILWPRTGCQRVTSHNRAILCGCPSEGSHRRCDPHLRNATGSRQIAGSKFGGVGGVDVGVDRPPLELGDRQHEPHPPTTGALWHLLCHNHSRTLCKWACRIRSVSASVWKVRSTAALWFWMIWPGSA